MVQSKPIDRRRAPRQERSRVTVEAILEASAQIICEHGYEKASTNRIAKRAGVSIGTLYQYFPNKEALIARLIDRHTDELMSLIGRQLLALVGVPLEEAVRQLIYTMLEAHRVNPELHRACAEQVHHVGMAEQVRDVTRRSAALVRAYLEQHRAMLRVDDLDMATFMIVTCVEAVTQNAVLSRPDYLGDDALVEHTTALVLRYLLKDLPAEG